MLEFASQFVIILRYLSETFFSFYIVFFSDYKDVMLSTPTFNLNDFAKNIENEVSLRQHMTPGHFKSVRGYFEKL